MMSSAWGRSLGLDSMGNHCSPRMAAWGHRGETCCQPPPWPPAPQGPQCQLKSNLLRDKRAQKGQANGLRPHNQDLGHMGGGGALGSPDPGGCFQVKIGAPQLPASSRGLKVTPAGPPQTQSRQHMHKADTGPKWGVLGSTGVWQMKQLLPRSHANRAPAAQPTSRCSMESCRVRRRQKAALQPSVGSAWTAQTSEQMDRQPSCCRQGLHRRG